MAGSAQPVQLQSQKLVKTLCFEALNQLSLLLKPARLGKDWRSLADLIGFSNEDIMYLAEDKEPVVELMKEWVKRHQEGATIGKLTEYLKKLGRLDVIEDLQDYFDKALTADEYKQSQNGRPFFELNMLLKSAALDDSPVTVHERYDVFISYAAADVNFAKEVVSQLETKYRIRACIDFRDFLPGPHMLDQIVEVIEQRCRKVIAILSENYVKCNDCDFQAKVAMKLSPG
eukprot:gene14419-5473_t